MKANKLTNKVFWDLFWERSSDVSVLDPNHFYFGRNGIFIKTLKAHVNTSLIKNVVEIGGGGKNYRLLAIAKWLDCQVTIIDYSPVGLRLAKDLFKKNKQKARFISSDFLSYSSTDKYDLVVHWGFIEHFTNHSLIIQKSNQLLKENGQIFFTMPNMRTIFNFAWKKYANENWSAHYFHDTKNIIDSMKIMQFDSLKKWHFGIPLISFDWEHKNILTFTLKLLQKVFSLIYRIFPNLGLYGIGWLSSERAFYGQKTKLSN